jgi:hypothetical protein
MDLSNLNRALRRGAVDMGMSPMAAKGERSTLAVTAANQCPRNAFNAKLQRPKRRRR